MNKRNFKKYVKEQIKGVPLEKQQNELQKMKECVSEVSHALFANTQKHYVFCEKCKKYIRKSRMKTISETKTVRGVCVYTDAGYGDDDMFADVTYNFTYWVCPKCGERKVKFKNKIRETNLRRRYG